MRGGGGGRRAKRHPLFKICHAYSTMMKLGTGIPYRLRSFKNYINHMTHPLGSADQQFCHWKSANFAFSKNRYSLHFDIL